MTNRSSADYQRARLNRDLRILSARYPGRATWNLRVQSNWFIRLNDVPLPRVCRPTSTHMKIVVPPTIYFPIRGQFGRYVNWRDVYVDPDLRIWRGGRWTSPPRYSDQSDGQGWHYLCLHLLPAD